MKKNVCISRAQQRFHIGTEAASLLIGLPLTIAAALAVPKEHPFLRAGLWVLAAAVVLVDGGLLVHWSGRR